MLLTPRISTRALAGLCRRLSTSLEAGLDVRRVWDHEVLRAGGMVARGKYAAIRDGVHRGQSLRDALAAAGDYFPSLFHELTDIGERTGQLSETFRQLADHYDHQIQLRRKFLVLLAWPLMELTVAVLAVGFLIWIMGVIQPANPQPGQPRIDPLGLGLMGNKGLAVYLTVVALVGLGILALVFAVRRGVFWAAPLQRLITALPGVGRVLQSLALARLAWSLHLTLNAGVDVRRAIDISLRSTLNARYIAHSAAVTRSVAAGNSIYESFIETGVFPADFLDALHNGEHTGRLVETMAILSRQYRERAEAAMGVLAILGFLAVMALVAALIITVVFQIFYSAYLGPINDALRELHH